MIVKLMPNDSHKSFYGKAIVYICKDGTRVLRSYNTLVAYIDKEGGKHRLWDCWSATTGRHVAAFMGKNKKEWGNMAVGHLPIPYQLEVAKMC